MPGHQGVIVDKSFLQACSSELFAEIAKRHHLLMPDALFYEMLSDKRFRARCFRKLPDGRNPITLIDAIGPHIQHELKHHASLGKPSGHSPRFEYQFNKSLRDDGYSPPDFVEELLREEQEALNVRVKLLLAAVETIPDMFPELRLDSGVKRPVALKNARNLVVSNRSELTTRFISNLHLGEAQLKEVVQKITPDWAIYRLVQTKLLFGLDIYERHGIVNAASATPKLYTKLEHDVIDQEYLILALLEGGFATEEQKLREMFKALNPNGFLLPPIKLLKEQLLRPLDGSGDTRG